MILIINTCKEELHYFEFVKPIEDVLKRENQQYMTVPVKDLSKTEIDAADQVIICGTSLKDFDYMNHLDKFQIKETSKPILGICAGMQIICTVFGCNLIEGESIGLNNIELDDFLGLRGEKEVYELHQKIIEENSHFNNIFDVKARSKGKNNYVQAIKHKEKNIYATLFHPEVRNKEIIKRFIEIKNRASGNYSVRRTRAS